MERLLATSAEKQRNEDELRERLLHPDARRAYCDFIAASVKDIDETLWDTFVNETFALLADFKRRSRALALPPPPAVVPVRLQDTRPAGTSTPNYQQQQPQSLFQQQVPTSFGYPQQPAPIYAPTQQQNQHQQQNQQQQQQNQQHQQQVQLQNQQIQQLQLQVQQAQHQVNIGKAAYMPARTPPQATLVLPVAGAPLAGKGASGQTNITRAGGSATATHNASSGSIGKMVANYTDSDCPLSVGAMNTPNYLQEEDKDD